MWLGLEQGSLLPASQHSAGRRFDRDGDGDGDGGGAHKEKALVEGVIGLWFTG